MVTHIVIITTCLVLVKSMERLRFKLLLKFFSAICHLVHILLSHVHCCILPTDRGIIVPARLAISTLSECIDTFVSLLLILLELRLVFIKDVLRSKSRLNVSRLHACILHFNLLGCSRGNFIEINI